MLRWPRASWTESFRPLSSRQACGRSVFQMKPRANKEGRAERSKTVWKDLLRSLGFVLRPCSLSMIISFRWPPNSGGKVSERLMHGKGHSTSKSRAAHSTEALLPALARLGAWSCSSSVERGFGIALAAKQLGQGQDEHVALEENILIIQQDILRGKNVDELDVKDVILKAKSIWASCCARVRKSGDSKRKAWWDKGLPRTAAAKPLFLARFLILWLVCCF